MEMRLVAIMAFAVLVPVMVSGESFRVVQWNIGHFAMGKSNNSTVGPKKSAARAAKYRAQIAKMGADFIGVSEYDPVFDTAGKPTTNAVFASYSTCVAGRKSGYQCNAVFARRQCVRSRVVPFDDRVQGTYFVDAVFKIGEKELHFVQTHLDWNMNEKATDARPRQIRQLIDQFKNEPYVIICGDFNVYGAGEYYPFVMSGFKLANCGEYGCLDTIQWNDIRMPCRRYPLDNIIVKGFDIKDVSLDDKDLALSDHRILRCTLNMKQ